MAEGVNDKKGYFTRSKRRSVDSNSNNPENERNPAVIDLTEEAPANSPLEGDLKNLECPICRDTCIHPARLPCGHIFCFLCVKGAAHGNKKCAMCRSPIPQNYFNNPELLKTPEEISDGNQEGFEWFYEGRHGWWQYDRRASQEIDSAWLKALSHCELLIAGYIYVIDFREMFQYRKIQPSKRRKIKRDLASVEKLGVAGLRDPKVPRRRHSEGDKGSHQDYDDYEYPRRPRRASSDSSVELVDFLADQFGDLSLNNSDDDDSYQ